MTELNIRQRRFAEAYAACGNASEAARKSGYSIRTAYAQGSRLLKHADVAARITELQAEASARAAIEVDDVIDMLLKSYKDAKAANQHGPSIRVAELLGKTLQLFTDKFVVEEQGISDKDLIEAMAAGDPAKRAAAQLLLGAKDTFDA